MADLTNFEKMTISLQSMTLADSYAIDRLTDTALGASFSGTLYGWPWGCTITKRTSALQRYKLTGDYDVSVALKNYIGFPLRLTGAGEIMDHVAGELGKSASLSFDDFSVRPFDSQATLMSCIGSLFSWTSQIPNIMVNVFLRGDSLHVLQRGKESSSYELVQCGPPAVSEEIMFTLMNQSSTVVTSIAGDNLSVEVNDPGSAAHFFSGTLGFGDASVSYTNGLVVHEVYTGTGGVVTTTYQWSAVFPPAVVTHKVVAVTGGSTTTTNYQYSAPWGVAYLVRESETVEDKDYKVIKTSIKRFTDVGNDSFKCDVEENGVLVSSQIVKGSPVQLSGPGANKKYITSSARVSVTSRVPVGGSNFPVTDAGSLNRIADNLLWLDDKTQQTVRVTCYDSHVCDFTETIIFAGSTFYLNSNVVNVTPQKVWQDLELVRWF